MLMHQYIRAAQSEYFDAEEATSGDQGQDEKHNQSHTRRYKHSEPVKENMERMFVLSLI